MTQNTIDKRVRWLMVFLWMVVIFCLSAQDGTESSELSGGVVDMVVKAFNEMCLLLSNQHLSLNVEFLGFIIRKCAHAFLYCVLAILTTEAWTQPSKTTTSLKNYLLPLCICILYAISDECHQLFIAGRSGEVRDVLVDTSGALVGLAIHYLYHHWLKKHKKI